MLRSILFLLLPRLPLLAGAQSCVFGKWTRLAIPHDESCTCDAAGTICDPNELCYSYPADFEEEDFDPATFQCYKMPCDDVSGRWIWFGRLPRPWISGDFTVWATVEIQQENCDAVMTVTTNVGETGPLGDVETRTFYAAIGGRETYFLDLFETKEERTAYYVYDGDDEPDLYNRLVFLQDFGDAAPEKQCEYSGSFVHRLGVMSNLGDDEGDVYLGTLARDVDRTHAIGDVVPEDVGMSSSRNCPEGYPRAWTNDKVLTPSSGNRRCFHDFLLGKFMTATVGIGAALFLGHGV